MVACFVWCIDTSIEGRRRGFDEIGRVDLGVSGVYLYVCVGECLCTCVFMYMRVKVLIGRWGRGVV